MIRKVIVLDVLYEDQEEFEDTSCSEMSKTSSKGLVVSTRSTPSFCDLPVDFSYERADNEKVSYYRVIYGRVTTMGTVKELVKERPKDVALVISHSFELKAAFKSDIEERCKAAKDYGATLSWKDDNSDLQDISLVSVIELVAGARARANPLNSLHAKAVLRDGCLGITRWDQFQSELTFILGMSPKYGA